MKLDHYRVEYPRDAIRLGEQGAVNNGEPGSNRQPLDGAREQHRLGEQRERVAVADQDPAEQHEAQLATGCLQYRTGNENK